ncbi:PD-(D/E)XK nuclease family protein [Serinibacter arcticus]|uniref:PD-(D/E)XK nuclease family protein n=1 Tax=Serinibacter arcticus TaxID=1655435 RepID=A0A2U1ZQY5_9MICO|nr:PD-(D/E)XK nuclease family protein [Serinibacter arcticus]PWD49386.1 PD-(D/E)XK nuclease family protein [Serinibacter arcticus]
MTAVVGLTGVERADGAVLAGLAAVGIAPAASERAGTAIPVATGIRHASDADDEVRLVVREVATLLESTPAHRIAVLYAAASPYARLLHERFAQAGIQVNGRGVRGVEERALTRGFLGLLRLPEHLFARAEVMRVLAEAPAVLDGRVAPVSRWEAISRAAAVVEGEDWDVRLGEWARSRAVLAEAELAAEDPRPGVVERHQRDARSAGELRDAVLGLRARLADGAAAVTWPALSAWASALFADVYQQDDGGRLPAEESYAAAAIAAATAQLASLGQVEPTTSLASAVEVLELELERAVPRVGRFGEGVHVSPLGETAALEADVVIAVGLAEDSYPGRLREDALLGEDARDAAPGLVPLRTRIDDRHRALLAALAAAPTALVTFPRGDLRRSTHRLPSRFVLPSLRDLAGTADGPRTELAASEWDEVPEAAKVGSPSFASSLLRTPAPADEQEWRVRAAAQDALDDPVVTSARTMLAARAGDVLTRYDGDLGGVTGLPDHATGQPVVAPTSLEQYADCPHAWFMERLLRVSPLQAPEEVVQVSPLEVGNLVHTCLDRLVSSSPALPQDGAPWSAADRDLLRRIFEEEADAAAARGVTGHPRLWQLERQALARDLERMLEDDDRWRASRRATVLASELSFGQNGAPPVLVPVAGGAVAMRGSADKVDRAADGTLLVTDVKTGKKAGYTAIEKDPVVGGTRLQLPVYAHAARAAYGGEVAEALCWFVRRDAGSRIAVTLDDELERRYSESVGTLVDHIARGWFPAVAPAEADVIFVRCPYCNPDGLGHGERRERWERQRSDPRLADLVALIDPEAVDPLSSGAGAPTPRTEENR